MAWNIPLPHLIHSPHRLQWTSWWRVFSLLLMICAVTGGGLWLWLKDPRLLLLTFCSVIVITLLFIGLVGWRLFSYGVRSEHAEGLAQENDWHLAEWQQWAQSGLDVVNYCCVFPPEVPHPYEYRQRVNSEQPFSLGPLPPLAHLFEELLAPLSASLSALSSPVMVCFSGQQDESTWRVFSRVWQKLGLPVSGLAGCISGIAGFAEQTTQWLEEEEQYARLVIFTQWTGSVPPDATDGALAWLIAPGDNTLCYRCRLHRPMASAVQDAQRDIEQFLTYQPLAMTVADLWFNAAAIEVKDELIVERCRRLREPEAAINPAAPAQQFIPHWLGKPGPATDWFTITLMMMMAEYHHSAQGLVLSQGHSLLLATVSTGARLS